MLDALDFIEVKVPSAAVRETPVIVPSAPIFFLVNVVRSGCWRYLPRKDAPQVSDTGPCIFASRSGKGKTFAAMPKAAFVHAVHARLLYCDEISFVISVLRLSN